MAITYGAAGWVRIEDRAFPGTIYIRLSATGEVVELYLDAESREITPAELRRLPLGRYRAQALRRPDLLVGMLGLMPGMEAAPDPQIRESVESAFEDKAPRLRPGRRVTLKPPTAGLTDSFLQDVAAAYRSAVDRNERPNMALAEQSGANYDTVRSWTYLARKKGFLAPVRRGETAG
ncbi:hypothetical protein OHB24_27200 [Kribbella sp. NBC_00482]|uniref:hypothetical protein n=1 Tax=Kribbella sp. NBC_00482 TaxID=2975968 RepID=UPI002E19BBA9